MSLVSVLMPMRNAAPYVEAALKSVLGQRGVDLEVVIVEDGSTDGSAQIVRGLGDARVRVLPGPRAGIAAAFNAALGLRGGDVVARCDADDLYPEGRLARQVNWLEEHPEFGAVCGRFSTMTSRGDPVSELECAGSVARELTADLRAGVVATGLWTYAVRTEALRRLGGCRSYFVTAEDIDLQLRLGETTRVWYEPDCCYCYRLHDSSVTHTHGRTGQEFYEAAARTFQTQRNAGKPDDLERGCPPPPPQESMKPADSPAAEIQGHLLGQAWEEHAAGYWLRALRTGLRACRAYPRNPGAWKSLAALAFKRSRKARGQQSVERS